MANCYNKYRGFAIVSSTKTKGKIDRRAIQKVPTILSILSTGSLPNSLLACSSGLSYAKIVNKHSFITRNRDPFDLFFLAYIMWISFHDNTGCLVTSCLPRSTVTHSKLSFNF